MNEPDASSTQPRKVRLLEFAIETPDGRLRGRMAAPEGPMRLAELALNAMALDERLITMAVAREGREGQAISCTRGCGVCCCQVVPLSAPEAWLVADLVGSLPPPRRDLVLERFRAANQILFERGFKERFLQPQESDEAVWNLGREYFELGLACPFLEEASCSIHPWRPSICREYLVTSPAAYCADPFTQPVARVAVAVRLSQALARLTAELLGGAPQLIPLTLAPLWAAEHRAEAALEWDAGQLIERLLELMSRK